MGAGNISIVITLLWILFTVHLHFKYYYPEHFKHKIIDGLLKTPYDNSRQVQRLLVYPVQRNPRNHSNDSNLNPQHSNERSSQIDQNHQNATEETDENGPETTIAQCTEICSLNDTNIVLCTGRIVSPAQLRLLLQNVNGENPNQDRSAQILRGHTHSHLHISHQSSIKTQETQDNSQQQQLDLRLNKDQNQFNKKRDTKEHPNRDRPLDCTDSGYSQQDRMICRRPTNSNLRPHEPFLRIIWQRLKDDASLRERFQTSSYRVYNILYRIYNLFEQQRIGEGVLLWQGLLETTDPSNNEQTSVFPAFAASIASVLCSVCDYYYCPSRIQRCTLGNIVLTRSFTNTGHGENALQKLVDCWFFCRNRCHSPYTTTLPDHICSCNISSYDMENRSSGRRALCVGTRRRTFIGPPPLILPISLNHVSTLFTSSSDLPMYLWFGNTRYRLAGNTFQQRNIDGLVTGRIHSGDLSYHYDSRLHGSFPFNGDPPDSDISFVYYTIDES